MQSLTTVTGGYHQPRRVRLKTEANLMTGRSKTMEMSIDLMLYHVTLEEPANTMQFSFSVRENAERIFNRFNIDKE